MTPDPRHDHSGLRWIRADLDETLRQARLRLEDFVEEDSDDLAECIAHLHHVHGSLEVVQVYGAAMLADELEALALALGKDAVNARDQAAEVLMLGMVQLPAYLERVESGEPDIPLILLPLLNDLRAARDAPLVSEISLFAPKLDSVIAAEEVAPGSGNPAMSDLVLRLRADYHRGLLNWYRDTDSRKGLGQIRDVIEKLASEARTRRLRRLLDASEALVVALQEQTLEPSVAVKLLFGKLDRVFKCILDQGEEAAAREFPLDLLKNQLYYVARSDSQDPVVQAVRRSADLANSFPDISFEDARKGSLGGPGKALFDAVGEALRGDLRDVKEQLDLYMRGDRSDLQRLQTLRDPVRKIADTLGMIGRGELRSRLMPHCDRIADSTEPHQQPDDDVLMAFASDLLFVESAVSGLSEGAAPIEPVEADDESPSTLRAMSDAEFNEHVQAAVAQASVEMAKTKDAILKFLAEPDPTLLSDVPPRLHAVSGALIVLEEPSAARLIEDLRGYLDGLATGDYPQPDQEQREALADLVSGVEYHMESVVEKRPDHGHALRVAESASVRLGLSEDSQLTEEVDESADADIVANDQTASADKPALDEIDSEILDVFIEEAREEVLAINEAYPRWRADSEQHDALARVRRAFHTLKGSGRLVGAKEIGEFAWSTENLLNRVIDGTVPIRHEIYEHLDAVIDQLPALIDACEAGVSVDADLSMLEAHAFELATPGQVSTNAPQQGAAPDANEAAADTGDIQAEAGNESALIAGKNTESAANSSLDIDAGNIATAAVVAGGVVGLVGSGDASHENVPAPETLEEEPDDSLDIESEELLLDTVAEPVDDDPSSSLLSEDSLLDVEDLSAEEQLEDSRIESILTPVSEELPPIALESTLFEIYSNETRTHLDAIQAYVENCRGLAAGCAYSEELRRALHTLRGSAHMAEVEPVAALAGAFESWVNAAADAGQRTDAGAIDLLERGHFVISALTSVINQAGAGLPSWEPLRNEVEQRTQELAQALEEAEESQESTSLAVDPELAEIFLEEAREIGEALEHDFSDWQSRPDDLLPVVQLQRQLHTMKGGARLAGLGMIGDLSHAMESVFESLAENRQSTSGEIQGLVRHALDALAGQVDALATQQIPASRDDLVERLETAARGEVWEGLDAGVEDVSTLLLDETQLPPGSESILIEEALPDNTVSSDSSTLLTDSQLLTDSELLGESEVADNSGLLLSELSDNAVGNVLHDDSRVIQFPNRGRHAAEVEFDEDAPPRQPPPAPEISAPAESQEQVRVRAGLLDQMVNNAGEVSIYRARLEQQGKTQGFNLDELSQTIERLRGQLRQLELETEAQILSRHEREHEGDMPLDFDPLEMDRYSTIQQLSRALSETVDDLASIGVSLQDINRDSETLLLQQERVNNDLQDGLLRTRMVPIASRAARLQRVVRQTAHSLGKEAELDIVGGDGEMDRAILERMMAPLEHLLRNAVAHGIELPEERKANDKPVQGKVTLLMGREGSDVLLSVSDDGRGLDREAIKAKALERGLIENGADLDDDDLDGFILEAGFSTAESVSQISGRGVGMDVVLSEVKQLGGGLEISSQPGRGSSFSIQLPFTLAIAESLLVGSGDEVYAVPHGSLDGVARISRADLEACYRGEKDTFAYGGREYQVRYLGSMLGSGRPSLPDIGRWFPILLVRAGEHRMAIHVDALHGNRQIVVKSVGAQLSTVRWFTGGTILADGRIALILDINALVRLDSAKQHMPGVEAANEQETVETAKVMVVDDSITVRKVTSRLLARHHMDVITAKDGVDAVSVLAEQKPDVMLLDIEMPRMDGFELARHMRSSEELRDIPIIMITSRTGDKHRNLAMELGVKRYLGKPYQEAELLETIYTVLAGVDDDE